jgi:hypothetical protein
MMKNIVRSTLEEDHYRDFGLARNQGINEDGDTCCCEENDLS